MGIPSRMALLGGGPSGAEPLVMLAANDGATAIYQFNEASGDLINRKTPGTFDHTVDAAVVRQIAGPDPEDLLAYRFSSAIVAGTPFGHTQGTRPSWVDSQAWTAEAICRRIDPVPAVVRYIAFAERAGGLSAAQLTIEDTGILNAAIQVSGQPFDARQIATLAESTIYAHYVWQWDGTTFRGWRNNVSKFAVAIGPGGTGLADSAPFNMAFGGVTGVGTLNSDSEVDFFAVYPTVHLTTAQIANHFASTGT